MRSFSSSTQVITAELGWDPCQCYEVLRFSIPSQEISLQTNSLRSGCQWCRGSLQDQRACSQPSELNRRESRRLTTPGKRSEPIKSRYFPALLQCARRLRQACWSELVAKGAVAQKFISSFSKFASFVVKVVMEIKRCFVHSTTKCHWNVLGCRINLRSTKRMELFG